MSALAKFIPGSPGAASRVKRFTSALAASDERLSRLAARVEEARAAFEESADASAVTAAETALAREQTERAVLVRGLETAQATERAEAEAQAARETEARHARLRVDAEKLGTEITEALVELGRLLGRSAAIMDALPPAELYRYAWPPTLAEAASGRLVPPQKAEGLRMGIATGTRRVEITLDVPV